MIGDFDDAPKWPMRGIINIHLLSHDETKHRLCRIAFVNDITDKGFGRLRHTDIILSQVWGCEKVIGHASLDASFLTNDCLHLRMELV